LGNKLINSDSLVSTIAGPAIVSKISLNEDLFLYFSRNDRVHYSRIEKNQINGEYVVTLKNIPIDTTTGGMYITKHANGTDKWLILTQRTMSRLKVYHISSNGIITSHSTFSHPRFYHNQSGNERLHVSPDGTKLLSQNRSDMHFELLQFDPGTGQLSNPIFIPPIRNIISNPIWTYNFIFSPNGSKLYVVDPGGSGMVQFDLTHLDSATIDQSRQWISSSISLFWDVTLAPDGALYMLGRMGRNRNQWAPPHTLNFSRIRFPDCLTSA
jgi:hypothetical protein